MALAKISVCFFLMMVLHNGVRKEVAATAAAAAVTVDCDCVVQNIETSNFGIKLKLKNRSKKNPQSSSSLDSRTSNPFPDRDKREIVDPSFPGFVTKTPT